MSIRILILVFVSLHSCLLAAMDYNGNPISKNGSITITPRTSSAILAGYTQAINFDGMLDQTFGSGGSTLASLGDRTVTVAQALALQPDGKLVVAGYSRVSGINQLMVARYTAAGILDLTFGTNGSTLTALGDGIFAIAQALALQPDGKLVVAGYVQVGGNNQLVVARYTPSGLLDLSFGTNGSTLTPLGDGSDTRANALVLQNDGKLVVAGYARVGGNNQLVVARYTTAGILDLSFGTNGSTLTPLGDGSDTRANALVLQNDGKLVVAGYARVGGNNQLVVARYTTAGILDLSFGTNGSTITSLGDGTNTRANALVLQNDGKLVVAGYARVGGNNQLVVARYTPSGLLDLTFGTNGSTLTPLGIGTNTVSYALVLQSDGKPVVAGYARVIGGDYQLAIARYSTTGILDLSFGANGSTLTALGNGTNTVSYALVLQSDGKPVVAGYALAGGVNQLFVTRYVNPFTLASFNASYGPVGIL
jgi:uncharacterized delta-60 repeat protein